MQEYADAFMAEERTGEENGLLQLKLYSNFCNKNFVSVYWEGTKDNSIIKLAENIDLLSQKTVTLADMLKEDSLAEVRAVAGTDWTEDRFCLTAEGGLVILKGSNESSQGMHYWTTEGKQLNWNKEYKELFMK